MITGHRVYLTVPIVTMCLIYLIAESCGAILLFYITNNAVYHQLTYCFMMQFQELFKLLSDFALKKYCTCSNAYHGRYSYYHKTSDRSRAPDKRRVIRPYFV